jgi:hypothetical protein
MEISFIVVLLESAVLAVHVIYAPALEKTPAPKPASVSPVTTVKSNVFNTILACLEHSTKM